MISFKAGEGTTMKMRKDMLKWYRENEKRAQHRIIDRRVLAEATGLNNDL